MKAELSNEPQSQFIFLIPLSTVAPYIANQLIISKQN